MLLEICISSVDDAIVAESAGAHRLELNSALPLGGLTPSLAALERVKQAVAIPVICMARPREGGFCYSTNEFNTLLRDVELFCDAGANGIAVGILGTDRRLDISRLKTVFELIRPREIVFHRAFDVVDEWRIAIDQLVDLGANRILTSGRQPTAIEGIGQIREFVAHADHRIEILPASGIRPQNVAGLVRETGCRQVHASLACDMEDASIEVDSPIRFSRLAEDHPAGWRGTDRRLVEEMIEQLRQL